MDNPTSEQGARVRAIVRSAAIFVATLTFLASASGIAAAGDPLTGKTYKEASATIAGWGVPVVIQTLIGSVLSVDDCTVISWQKGHRTVGGTAGKQVVLLNLNCNAAWATAGSPGASVANPAARDAKAAAEKAQKTADWCARPAQANYEGCQKFWQQHEDLHAEMIKVIKEREAKDLKTAKWCAQPEQANYEPCAKFCSEHDKLCTAT